MAETIRIDGAGAALPWFNPAEIAEVDHVRLRRLLSWDYDAAAGCYRVKRRAAHKVGRVMLGQRVFAVLPDLSAADFTTFFLYALGVDISRFTHHQASPITAALGDEHIDYDKLVATLLCVACEDLASGYLARGYERKSEKLSVLRGRVDWMRSIAAPKHLGLPCHYHEITSDNLLNRTVLAGLSAARQLDLPLALRQRLSKLEFAWSSVCRHQYIRQHDLESCEKSLNRLTESYRPVLALCRMLLFGYVPDDFFGGRNSTLQCLEFDLAAIFERFVYQIVKARLQGTGVDTMFQPSSGNELLDGFGALYQATRPDFLLRYRGQTVAVLDAKFKPRYVTLVKGESFSTRNKLDQSDVYQMLFYADRVKSGGDTEAFVIAPRMDGFASVPNEANRTVVWRSGLRGRIVLRVVDVDLIATIKAIRSETAYPQDGLADLCRLVTKKVSSAFGDKIDGAFVPVAVSDLDLA
ncbi:5-methylcytosine restriction system specificity protein McrC [Pseudoxanthomonas mexicana]